MPAQADYLTLAQAANRLGVDRHTLRRWIRDGALPSERRNGQHAIRADDVERIRREGIRA